MKYAYILLTLLIINSCGWNDQMKNLDAAHAKADNIIALWGTDSVLSLFPEKYFPKSSITPLNDTFRSHCDWKSKRGKWIDFYTVNDNGDRSIYYIYEYFLNCDSLRFILGFDINNSEPELKSMNIEPLEKECSMLIDPMNSILKDKEWDKKKP